MKKKHVFSSLAFLVFALGLPAQAQQQAKTPKIGFLGARPAPSSGQEIWRYLREIRNVEGKNLAIEYRHADNKLDRLPTLADELVRLKVDVIITPGANDTQAAKNATRTIPIVFLISGDPVAAGLIDSLAHPGGNITGFTTIAAELPGKKLELLKETVPKLSRVAVLWEPKAPSSAQGWKESQLPARALGLQLHSMEVSSAEQLEGAFQEATKARSSALIVIPSSLANSNQKLIVDLATKKRLPAIYPREDWVASGGLMAYGAEDTERYRRAAVMIDKILKGTKPADIPVEQPKSFEFIVNLNAAKQIGVTIPPNVLVRAQRVIR